MITAKRKLHANILLKSSTKSYDHQDLEHCVTVLLCFFFFLSSILVYLVLLPLKLSTMHILQFGCHTSCSRFEDHFSINHIYRVQSQTCRCLQIAYCLQWSCYGAFILSVWSGIKFLSIQNRWPVSIMGIVLNIYGQGHVCRGIHNPEAVLGIDFFIKAEASR